MAGVIKAGSLRDRTLGALAFARKNGGRLLRDEVTGYWGGEGVNPADASTFVRYSEVKRLVTDKFMRWGAMEQFGGEKIPVEAIVVDGMR